MSDEGKRPEGSSKKHGVADPSSIHIKGKNLRVEEIKHLGLGEQYFHIDNGKIVFDVHSHKVGHTSNDEANVAIRKPWEDLKSMPAVGRFKRSGITGKLKSAKRATYRAYEMQFYLSTDDAVTAVRIVKAVGDVLTWIGVESWIISEVRRGSVLVKLKSMAKKFKDKREVRRVVSQAYQAAEAGTVDAWIAQNNERNGNALAALVAACHDANNVAFDFGTLQLAIGIDEAGHRWIRGRALTSRQIAENRIDEATLINAEAMKKLLSGNDGKLDTPPI